MSEDDLKMAEKHGWRYWFDNYQEMLEAATQNAKDFMAANATIAALKSQLAEATGELANTRFVMDKRGDELEDDDKRIAALESQLAEANMRAEVAHQNAVYLGGQLCEQSAAAEARAEAAERQLALAREHNELIVEVEREDAARLRAALEKVEWVERICPWCFWCDEGHKPDCPRQLALQAAAEQPAPPNCIAYPRALPERPTCVWLSDGMKIGIQREGGAAWLRIEKAPTVHAAEQPDRDHPSHGKGGARPECGAAESEKTR